MEIKVTFLGTGTSQGVPMIGCRCEVCLSGDKRDKRLRSSVMVEVDDVVLVIDTTPDFRYQMLRTKQTKLHGVLYTHEHKDHTGGMDDVRSYNYLMGGEMDIYCEKRVERVLRKDFDYAFELFKYPGVPEVRVNVIDENPFEIRGIKIIPIRGLHYRLPVLGFRIGDFCYITDMNYISQEEQEKMKNLDVLVINALRHQKHISHFSLGEALDIIDNTKPRKAYLTHISHQLGRYEDLIKMLPENVEPAVDGMKIKIANLADE